MAFWPKSPNLMPTKFSCYTVFHCIATHQAVVHQDILSTADSEIHK